MSQSLNSVPVPGQRLLHSRKDKAVQDPGGGDEPQVSGKMAAVIL